MSATTQDAALAAFAQAFAYARSEREQIAATGGAEAVARWAAPGCTEKQRDELAAYYEQLQHEAGAITAA